MKRKRVIGTTDEAIAESEAQLGHKLPPSFRAWLREHNGLALEGIHIYPVRDERDVRMTWDSIVRNYQEAWTGSLENFEDEERDFSHLLPFADFGTGDYYCFDYSVPRSDGEMPVVRWSHENGDCEYRAASFPQFEVKLAAGDFRFD